MASGKRRTLNSDEIRLMDSEWPRQMKPPGLSASNIASGGPLLFSDVSSGKRDIYLQHTGDDPAAALVTLSASATLDAPGVSCRVETGRALVEAVRAARGRTVVDKLSQDTALAVGNSSAEFSAFIQQEQARWKPVIARAQIKPEGA